MTDLIWVGNTLYPRWFVFAAMGLLVLAVYGSVHFSVKFMTTPYRWFWVFIVAVLVFQLGLFAHRAFG